MSENRTRLFFVFFVLYFFLLICRLFNLQILQSTDFKDRGDAQREGMVLVKAKRGDIFAQDMFALASSEPGYILNFDKFQFNKKLIAEFDKKLKPLVQLLIEDENVFGKVNLKQKKIRFRNVEKYILNLMHNPKIKAGVIYKKLSEDTKKKIERLKLPGLYFTSEDLRRYLEKSLFCHGLGFLGRSDQDEPKGFFGLEGFYDLELKGVDGFEIYERDPLGKPILLNLYERKEPINGSDLVLTIDRGAQKIIEKWLVWGVKKYGAVSGTTIVYDPQNGEILAAANYPAFDPNYYYRYESSRQKNVAVSDVFEPGSIMKPLIMAAAINERLVDPTVRCPVCAGPREKSGFLIKTFDDSYSPNLTMQEVLNRSDNTGMTFVGDLLGKTKILNYYHKLGFGSRTGVDLQGEVEGYVKTNDEIYDIDLSTMTFGQGVSVTAMQIVKAWGSLVTGATFKPHLVSVIKRRSDEIVMPAARENVIYSLSTVDKMTKMLKEVTEKSPLQFARDTYAPELKKYQIAAKSGTAQVAIAGNYEKNKTVGSAIGFPILPGKKKFLLFVKLDEPRANIWGANTAGPIFFLTLKDLLLYFDIAPG